MTPARPCSHRQLQGLLCHIQLRPCQPLPPTLPARAAGTRRLPQLHSHSPAQSLLAVPRFPHPTRATGCSAEEEPQRHFPSTVPLVPARQDVAGSPCPLLLLATKITQQGPAEAWHVLSAHGLSLPGQLRAPSPVGCPCPQGGCAATPGSYSQRLELGTGMGTFLNRGLWFTCTRTGREELLGSTSPRGARGRHRRQDTRTSTQPGWWVPVLPREGDAGDSHPQGSPQPLDRARPRVRSAGVTPLPPRPGEGGPVSSRAPRPHLACAGPRASCPRPPSPSPHPLLLLLLLPPTKAWKGIQASGPAPAIHRAPAAARGPAGPGRGGGGTRGLGPPRGPGPCSRLCRGSARRGGERSGAGGPRFLEPSSPAPPGGNGDRGRGRSTPSTRGARSPWGTRPLAPLPPPRDRRPRGRHAGAPRRSRPRPGGGCQAGTPARGPRPLPAPGVRGCTGAAGGGGAHAAARQRRRGWRDAPRPHSAPRPPRAGEPLQTGSTGTWPGSPLPPAPTEPRRSPMPAGVRWGEAQPRPSASPRPVSAVSAPRDGGSRRLKVGSGPPPRSGRRRRRTGGPGKAGRSRGDLGRGARLPCLSFPA